LDFFEDGRPNKTSSDMRSVPDL